MLQKTERKVNVQTGLRLLHSAVGVTVVDETTVMFSTWTHHLLKRERHQFNTVRYKRSLLFLYLQDSDPCCDSSNNVGVVLQDLQDLLKTTLRTKSHRWEDIRRQSQQFDIGVVSSSSVPSGLLWSHLTCTSLRSASTGLQGVLLVQQQVGGRLPSFSFSNVDPTKSV